MKCTFSIPGKLPTLNEIIAAYCVHRMAGASQKKKNDKLCSQWILVGNVPVFTGALHVHFDWYSENARKDRDNICAGTKFILDALVQMGRIPGDGPKTVTGLSHSFFVDKQNPRIGVTIESCAA